MDFKSRMDYRFDQLKKDVIHVLKKHPDGVPKSDIWSLVHNDTGRIISAKQYGLKKLSNVLERWTDDIKTEFSGKTPRLMLKDTSVYSNDFSKSIGNDSFASGIMAELKRRTEKAGIKIPATSTSACNDDTQVTPDSPDSSESDDDSDTTSEENTSNSALLVRHKCLVRQWVLDFFREEQILCCGFSILKKYVIKRMQKHFDKTSLKTNTWKTFLYGHCKDLVRLKVTKKSIEVYLLKIDYKEGTQRKEVKEKEGQSSTAMSLLTKMSTLNRSKNSSEDAKCISLQHDENPSKQSEIIDLTNESEPSASNSQKSGNTSKFGAFSVPFNVLQPMRVDSKPIKLGESSASATFGSGVSNIRENSFLEFESSLPGIQNRIIEIINAPINTTPFPVKRIDVRQVHVPHGRLPAREYVDDIAKECIEILADANESVTMERVEQMVCQRFGCYNIRQLGFQYTDQIPCINELNRLLSKINLYVIAFVKARSICTLYELKEAIQDHEAGSADFESLRLGPLQRLPVVYQQFHFPTDHAEIPQVTTMDILDHFQNYLTKFRLWSGRLDLEPFLDYLAEEYDVPNYNMIGCKVRSLPLAATVLKKAQRDSRNQQQQIVRHFKDELKTEIGDAFRKFRASILVTGAGEGMEVRQHYMKMRPELALLEIFDKFNILFMVTQTGNRKWTRNAKFRHLIGEFLTTMRADDLCRDLLHLSICMSSTQVAEAAMELLVPEDVDSDGENEPGTSSNKPPPRKDALIESARTYIERCLNAGAITLTHLDRIEEKMLEDFGYSSFNMMGYGRFIEFLLLEIKQLLEECGGLSLGSGSGGVEADSAFKPHLTDLIDFIKQCKQCGQTEPDQIKEALCNQYNVKEVRHLGYGNITRLLSYADKHGGHTHGECSVSYESTLVQSTGQQASSISKVGILGHQTKDAAKICLHNCPLLENLADWSQWSLVFEPELGKLKDFILKYGGVTTKTLEGGKLATFDILALESRPGDYLKIVSTTSPDHVVAALEQKDAIETAGHLVSMSVAYKGVENMPLALLSGHVKTALLQMHSDDSSSDTALGKTGDSSQHKAVTFVKKCLLTIPTKVCVALANQIFLDPLGQVVGSSKSKQLLIQLCETTTEQNRLVQLGCLLGIHEWTDMIQQKCKLSASSIQILPPEVEELFGDVTVEDEDEDVEMYMEDGEEDVDEILAGDLCNDKKKMSKTDAEVKKIAKSNVEGEDESVDMIEETVEGVKLEGFDTEQCEDIVKQIRKDEFGVGVHLSEDGQRLMKIQQERLGRSLERLSKDLYSKDTHFVLELVQNADDNSYHDNLLNNTTDECPSVKFVIGHDGINVLNNELGFSERDIRALCDVGRSTKGKHKFGYIGQKGIGFKSVFRITDAPEVHSNGFHIKFDVNSGPMGYILPHWIPDDERIEQDKWMTHIVLGLKPEMKAQTRTLAARFNDIHPSLLLFLHRLREITIENKVENSVQMMRRRDIGDSVVEIQHSHGSERWLVVKKMLDARKISLQAKSGADVESTEIALAFPLKQNSEQNLQTMPPKQPVFAFLPLRSYGFRFIIQGDFDVPSSREDVDRDSPWNQWLRNEIPMAFIDALDAFKTHQEFSSIEAVCKFLQFVPMEDEVLDFFKPVASDILKKLRAKPCVPTQPNDHGAVSWKIPSQTVIIRDPLVHKVITADLLQTHLNLFYLHNDVASILNQSLSSCLGIETLTFDHLFQLGKALVVDMGNTCTKEEDVVLIAQWMACLYRSLDEFHHEDTILNTLKSCRIMPLASGELVALKDKTVFYPEDNSTKKKKPSETLSLIHQDVNSLNPLLMNTDDDEVNSQVHKLLLRLGIKQLCPFDVINYHILPVLKTNALETKSAETLVAYLVYIKEQTEKQSSVCNLEEIKDVAMVKTNQGFKIPAKEPVHFSPKYGNPVNLQETFFGYDWTLLDDCYLPEACSQPVRAGWMDFFKKLGVEEFLSIRQTEIKLKREELIDSPWSEESTSWPAEKSEFIIHDYQCAELEGLITRNQATSREDYAKQMRSLCTYLDKNWENNLSKYCLTHVHDKDGIPIKEIDTSFSSLLKTASWLPAIQTDTTYDIVENVVQEISTVMKEPKCLYMKSEAVEKLLSNKVLYLDIQLDCEKFYQVLGLRNSVSIDTMKEYIMKWSERVTEGTPATFCTSLEHMINVYSFLGKEMKRKEFQDLLREKPVFFVPNKSSNQVYNSTEVLPGKMLNRNEIWLSDPTGLFEKYRKLLEEFQSDICCKRTIENFYKEKSELIELFNQEGKLDQQPKVEEYLELLCLLCRSSSPKVEKILSDVLYIFSILGGELVKLQTNTTDEQTTNVALETLKSTIKTTLQKKKVFPTCKHIWVSLDDVPLINNDDELAKMFFNKPGVHFLDMEVQANNKSRKGKFKKSAHKVQGRHIDQERIDEVLEVCCIEKISDVVDSEPTPDMIEPCKEMQLYFSQIIPYIQQYLMSRFSDVYEELDQMKTRDLLNNAKFFQAGKLEVRYWLTKMVMEVFVIREEKCKIAMSEFYFHKDHLSNLREIQKEVARHFSCGDTSCYTALRSFLSELSNIVNGVTNESMESVLLRHGARIVEVSDDQKWSVDPPVIEMPNESETELEENMVEDWAHQYTENEFNVNYDNDPRFVLRQWPPMPWPPMPDYRYMGPEGTQKPRGKQAHEAAEYRRTVRGLPTSIRLVDNEGQETVARQARTVPSAPITNKRKLSTSGEEDVVIKKRWEGPIMNKEDNNKDQQSTKTHHEGEDIHFQPSQNITDNDKDQQSTKKHQEGDDIHFQPSKNITGEPIWNQNVSDYTVDELGTGKDIPVAKILNLDDSQTDLDIGRWGEQFVAQYLDKQKEFGNILDYKWRNQEDEAGFPFDFEVQVQDEHGIRKDYIEVKSTLSNDKEVFQVSVHQIKFADEKAERFHIYRVYNAGNPDKVRLIRITNLNMRLSSKQVKLCMII